MIPEKRVDVMLVMRVLILATITVSVAVAGYVWVGVALTDYIIGLL